MFSIPNEADASVAAQAAPDSKDVEILVAGYEGTGVVSGAAVTAQGTPDMTLAVASGTVSVLGVSAAVTAGNVTITTAHATNPRFDLVVVNSSGTKSVTAGTAAVTPVFPAIPASSVVLAAVYVPANDTAIGSTQIVDKRVPAVLVHSDGSYAASTTDALRTRVIGDANSRYVLDADGTMWSGDGASAAVRALFTKGSTALGRRALEVDTSGNSTALGSGALQANTSGSSNIAIGGSALQSNTTGNSNSALGVNALAANTTGSDNTAVGIQALQSNTTGARNTALGVNALQSNTTGNENTAAGISALQSNTTGSSGTALGFEALKANTSGSANTAFGFQGLKANTTGSNNTAVGIQALQSNTTGARNTALGVGTLGANTTGDDHLAVGVDALVAPAGLSANATTTGLRQTALGVQTGQNSATQRNDIVAIGYRALVDGNNAVAIGSGVLAGAAGTVAIGKDSAGTSASSTVADEIKLGTALHTTTMIGDAKVGGSGKTIGLYGATPVARAAAIAAPTAPSAIYVQAEATSMKTAVDAIRVALTNIGVTL